MQAIADPLNLNRLKPAEGRLECLYPDRRRSEEWEREMKRSIFAAGLGLIATMAQADEKPVLNVYTYDSFTAEWGPGPAVEAAFEATCECDLQFTAAGDGAALLARVQLEGARSKADVVLGLDTNLTARAEATGLFAEHGLSPELSLPVTWKNSNFLPFDFGYFAFIHNADLADVPTSFTELAASDLKIVIQDPRSSTPGLGLAYWVQAVHGEDATAVWADLADNVLTVTKGWSEAYGLFLEGEADMVLSYTTSPSYHVIAEGDETKKAALFDAGHYMQIEVAGILKASENQALAQEFMAFMVSDAFQEIIPTTNWMFPAATPSAGLPEGFAAPIAADKALLMSDAEAEAARDAVLAAWLEGLGQ